MYALIFSLFLSIFSNGKTIEDRWFHSQVVTTRDLHNITCGGNDPTIICVGNWAATEYTIRLEAPLGYVFVGQPELEFIGGDLSALQWNNFADPNNGRYSIIQNDNTLKIVKIRPGSHSFQIGLKCLGRKD